MKPAAFDELASVERRHWWYRGMRHTARSLLGEPRGDVLDAGCGTATWLGTLAPPGRRAGVDLHRQPLEMARTHGVDEVAQGSITALPFPDGAFDLLTSIDVIYHQGVTADTAALDEFWRVLRPGGTALIQVPAYNWLRSRHDDEVATRERYTAGRLRTRLERARFHVDRLTYANTLLLPVAIVWRLLARVLPSASGRDLSVPPILLNRALEAVLRLEQRWLVNHDLAAGLSILAVATKPLKRELPQMPIFDPSPTRTLR